jgi:hypothetical protein
VAIGRGLRFAPAGPSVPKISGFGTSIFGDTKQRRCWVFRPPFSEGFRNRAREDVAVVAVRTCDSQAYNLTPVRSCPLQCWGRLIRHPSPRPRTGRRSDLLCHVISIDLDHPLADADWIASAQLRARENSFATANAPSSLVSSAIFCASMTSPATKQMLGTKHQPTRAEPSLSISWTFSEVP